MWQQIRNFGTQTTVALRSALAGWLTRASIRLEGSQFGLLLQTLSKKIQNKFTITLEFEDGTKEEIHLTETEWNSIDTAAKMSDLTIEEFVLTAIKMAVEKYN